MWIQDTFYKLFGIKSQYEIDEARKKERKERYDALSPEDQRELDRRNREFERELEHTLQEINQEKQRKEQHKEHQHLIVKMEQDRIMRENKIRDFRNRHGREPSSWEI
jgi:sugar-specific transcriptional regulator TrmB